MQNRCLQLNEVQLQPEQEQQLEWARRLLTEEQLQELMMRLDRSL